MTRLAMSGAGGSSSISSYARAIITLPGSWKSEESRRRTRWVTSVKVARSRLEPLVLKQNFIPLSIWAAL